MRLHGCLAVSGLALTCLVLIASPSTSNAADTQLAWEGFSTVTSATAQCAGIGGTGKGDTHVSIYRPKIVATDTASFLSTIFLRSAITIENDSEVAAPQMHGAGNYTGTAINSRGKSFSYSATYNFTINPSSISATTKQIHITGTVDNWFNVAGCSVSFKAIYEPRID